MHVKDVPSEAIAAVKNNKLLLIGGAAVLAFGVYAYSQSQQTSSSGAGATDPWSVAGIGPSTVSGADTIGSILGGGGGGGGGSTTTATDGGATQSGATSSALSSDPNAPLTMLSPTTSPGVVTSVTLPTGSIDPSSILTGGGNPTTTGPFPNPTGMDAATAELLAQARIQMTLDYSYNMANLALEGHIVDTNAWLQQQNLRSLDYQTAANLASTFMMSNNALTIGTITGPDGQPIIDMSFMQARESKGNSWNQDLQGLINRGTVTQYYQETGHPYTTQPLPEAGYGPPPGNASLAAPSAFNIAQYLTSTSPPANGYASKPADVPQFTSSSPSMPSMPSSSVVNNNTSPAPAQTSFPSLTSIPSSTPSFVPQQQPTLSGVRQVAATGGGLGAGDVTRNLD